MLIRRTVLVLAAVIGCGAASAAAQDAPPLSPLPADVPAGARIYTVLSDQRPGRQAVWRDPDGTTNVIYQRRHPDNCETAVRSTITVDAVGAIVFLRHTGRVCEPGRIVDEHYGRSGSLGLWRNGVERGEGDVIGKKFYVSANAVPEERALLVRALLASGHQLELLPAGDARLERVRTHTVRAGAQEMIVTHYRVYGLRAEPVSVWLDRTSELFALGPDLIRAGWEAAADILRGETAAGTAPAVLQGAIPDAAFETTLRKFTPPDNLFSPFYSWDAVMTMHLTVYRQGAHALMFRGTIQAVGTRNFGSRIGVGGTGYVLGVSYAHTHSSGAELSAGIAHLSSHLTRDLDEKLDEERRRGATIPIVDDPSEYNVLFVRAARTFPAWTFAPELDVAIAPVNFRFHGGRHGHVRPLHVGTSWTVWQGSGKAVVAETQHEFGRNALHHFALALELHARTGAGGRFRMFVSASPGRALHVSPHLGGVRDGIAFGVRVRFRA